MKKLLLALALTAFLPFTAVALDFAAEIVDLDGSVTVTPKATGKPVPAKKGMKLSPGDTIETKGGAEAELLYDDGNVTRLDEDTKLSIRRLSVEDDKSRQTVLDLAVGRVKNSVSKLASQKSKFEVHTKTAVAGVTGTPPWTVGAFGKPGGQQRVEVDLMPNGNGGAPTKGVFVRGTDAGGTTVNLSPGMRTTALPGAPPVSPIPISPARLQQLQTSMPITTTPEVQQEKKQELEKKIEKEVKAEEKSSSEEKKEEKKEEAKKEEAKKEEEKKAEEVKNEESSEETKEVKKDEPKKEEAKKEEVNKEEPKQEAKKETKREEARKEETPKKSDTPKETVSRDTKIETPVMIGTAGGDSSTSKAADAPPPPPAPLRTSSASMMEHISNNVSVGSVGTGTQVSDTGDTIGAASLSGANQNALPAATRVRVMVNITNK